MKKIGTIALLALLSSGCATQTYVLSPTAQEMPTYDKGQTFFVSGLGQEQEVNVAEICSGANNVAKVETQQNFLNVVLGQLSSGIYTPRQMKVYCK